MALGVEVGEEVVDCLGEDSGPVDGVDGSQTMGCVEFGVSKEGFDDILRYAHEISRDNETNGI